MSISINRTIKTCSWVLGGPLPKPTERCGAPCKWHWAKDEDGQKVKSYETYCPEHKAKAAKADD